MTINSRISTFNGHRVVDFDDADVSGDEAVRVSGSWDSGLEGLLAQLGSLADQPRAAALTSLVIGGVGWQFPGDGYPPVVEWLTANADRFPSLAALFVGDVTVEENEISWIEQVDPAPLVLAFSGLEVLVVRGSTPLSPVSSPTLRRLAFETGGLPAGAVAGVIASDLPALEDLELWLGVEEYGRTTTLEDLGPLLRTPPASLGALRLRNADDTEELLAAVLAAPVLGRLHTLDVSMGTLTDDGARQLLDGPALDHLSVVELSDNYLGDGCLAELIGAGLPIVSRGQREAETYKGEVYYYPSVTE